MEVIHEMRWNAIYRCVVIAALWHMLSWDCGADEVESRSVDAYSHYLAQLRQVQVDLVFRDRVDKKGDEFTNALHQRWIIDFDGRRLWRRTRRVPVSDGHAGGSNVLLECHETMITPSAAWELTVDTNTNIASSSTGYLDVPADYWETRNGLLYAAYPFGYLTLDGKLAFIPDLLKSATLRVSESSGVSQITGRGNGFQIVVDVDTGQGGAARRIEFSHQEEGGERKLLYEVREMSQFGDVWFPRRYACTISKPPRKQTLPPNVEIVDGEVRVVTKEANGGKVGVVEAPAVTLVAEVEMSEFEVRKLADDDFALRATIPDGLDVDMQDALHLDYAWSEGKVIPRSDAISKLLVNGKFSGGRGQSRSILIVANCAVLAVIIGVYIFRRLRRPS